MNDQHTIQLAAINDLRRHNALQAEALAASVARVLDSGWFILGRELATFEAEFAAYCGVAHCIGVANGTDALELALRASGVQPGGHVLTVANAGAYGTTAIRAIGAEPVFVDVDEDTLLIDATEVLHRLASASPAALIVTHLYGRVVPAIAQITAAAKDAGVPLIEDCAQAHGARLGGRMAGSFGDFGCFSFYPTKNFGALGDGGAVVTCSDERRDRVRMLRQYGWAGKYRIELAGGRNSRLDEVQAAVLRTKLPLLDGWNERRRQIGQLLSGGIRHPKVRCPSHFGRDNVAHLYVVRVDDRQSLRAHLRLCGIATDIHYPLLDYQQPAFGYRGQRNPVAERACREVLTLPCFPEMTDKEAAAVVEAVNFW